jgi:hypothetical protein
MENASSPLTGEGADLLGIGAVRGRSRQSAAIILCIEFTMRILADLASSKVSSTGAQYIQYTLQ